MRNQKGFAGLAVASVLVLLGVAGAAVVVYKKSQENSRQNTVSKPVAKAALINSHDKTVAKTNFILPENWRLLKTDSTKPNFAYPSEYGDFTPPAKGMAGKYSYVGYVSGKPSKSSVEGLYDAFNFQEYTDSSPVISSSKYGPEIQLKSDGWKRQG